MEISSALEHLHVRSPTQISPPPGESLPPNFNSPGQVAIGPGFTRWRRRDLGVIALVAVAALGVRVYPAWTGVFGGPFVNFLETDAWYHLRLVENQVANYPWRITIDPYAAAGGQFVPIAPLYDTLTATAVVALHGRMADSEAVARVAAVVPPVLGALAVFVAGWLAGRVFGARAGWLAAALLAVWPGHFMDRTMLGFVDHHALEALLMLATLAAVIHAIGRPAHHDTTAAHHRLARAGLAGLVLGLYALAWASAALLVAILAVWLIAVVLLSRSGDVVSPCASVLAVAAIVALGLVWVFQHHDMHRFDTQVISLLGLTVMALAVLLSIGLVVRVGRRDSLVWGRLVPLAALFGVGLAGSLVMWLVRPEAVSQLLTDAARLRPDPARMGVLEARPLFMYSGEWSWQQPWQFFRSGFYVGLVGLVGLALRIWRERRVDELLLWVVTAAMFAATIGQNRFGYYLIPACAVLGGWVADRLLAFGDHETTRDGWRAGARRLLPTLAVAGLLFAPALPTGLLLHSRTGMLVAYWQEAFEWLAQQTPPPFTSAGLDDGYYLARYPPVVIPDYAVMNWWDQGYYLIQRTHRVPVSNPTQERAGIAARFYTETDELRARGLLEAERARYVLADWELPFRLGSDGRIAGRFQTLADWADVRHTDYYDVCYRRTPTDWTPVWIFYEPYYRSMAYRLGVLGGEAATPTRATSVITLAERQEPGGPRFCEVIAERTFATYEAARVVADAAPPGDTTRRLAGLDPWQAAFPIPALTALREVHAVRTPDQRPTESPWVRIFLVE